MNDTLGIILSIVQFIIFVTILYFVIEKVKSNKRNKNGGNNSSSKTTFKASSFSLPYRYFNNIGSGWIIKTKVSDEEFTKYLNEKLNQTDWKAKALEAIGLDISEISEVEPIHFEGFYFNDKRAFVKYGSDGIWRSSMYEITWLFFSKDEIYLYQYIFDTCSLQKKTFSQEFFYKDITTFSCCEEQSQRTVLEKSGFFRKEQPVIKCVKFDTFNIVVPGDKLTCTVKNAQEAKQSIQGLKTLLREKKR